MGGVSLSDIVLVRVAIAMIKHGGQKQVGKKKVYTTCPFTSQSIIEESQGRSSSRAEI